MKKLTILLAILLSLSACVLPPPKPRPSALEIRQAQTRTYDSSDQRMIMKALLNVLQDEGFMTKNAVADLGLITASKETDMRQSVGAAITNTMLFGGNHRFPTNAVIEATANVSERKNTILVRVNFQRKVLDNFGATMSVHQLEDPLFYQDFFAKVDKGIFYQRERL